MARRKTMKHVLLIVRGDNFWGIIPVVIVTVVIYYHKNPVRTAAMGHVCFWEVQANLFLVIVVGRNKRY